MNDQRINDLLNRWLHEEAIVNLLATDIHQDSHEGNDGAHDQANANR